MLRVVSLLVVTGKGGTQDVLAQILGELLVLGHSETLLALEVEFLTLYPLYG